MPAARRPAVDPLGHSLRFDDGDLVLEKRGAAPVGLAGVRGERALAQALRLTIETQLGSDLINTGYGFDAVALGALAYGLQTRREFVKLQLVRTIAADRRVKEIRDLYFNDADRASRRFEATVEIETRTGSVFTFDVGGIGV
jgi:hypothetical protein